MSGQIEAIYHCCMLDVTRLRVLVAVARHGSVTAAARALNYAQPSVSHHLARLEAETGARLTQRSGRGIELTDAGRLLAGRAEEILGRLDAAERELTAHVEQGQERVALAGFSSALATIVPAALTRLAAAHPGIDLLVMEAEQPEAMRMLRTGQVDVALVVRHMQDGTPVGPPAGGEGTRARVILDEQVHLVTRPQPGGAQPGGGQPGGAQSGGGQPGTRPGVIRPGGGQPGGVRPGGGQPGGGQPGGGQPGGGQPGGARPAAGVAAWADLAAYAQSPWIVGCEHCRGHLLWLCQHAGFSPKIAVTTDDHVAAQALVAAGMGVTILPGLAIRAARHPGIRAQPLPGACRQVLALSYSQPPGANAVDALLDVLCLAAAATTTGPGPHPGRDGKPGLPPTPRNPERPARRDTERPARRDAEPVARGAEPPGREKAGPPARRDAEQPVHRDTEQAVHRDTEQPVHRDTEQAVHRDTEQAGRRDIEQAGHRSG
jgi:DNA-binding transcriptional LysR family regulator